jgi:hypothetical protein
MGNLDHPPKIGKPGAQKIRDLLGKESESLAANTKKLADALAPNLKKRFDPNADLPKAAFEAIHDIRVYYQELRSDIAAVKTSDKAKSAKQDILDGLADIDSGYKACAKALKKHTTPEGTQGLKRGQALAVAGTKQVTAGKKAL